MSFSYSNFSNNDFSKSSSLYNIMYMLETEITDRIKALTEQDWQELQALYELVMAHKGSFSEMGGGQEPPDGAIEMPYTIEKPIMREVRQFIIDKHLQVMFNWSHWSEGKEGDW